MSVIIYIILTIIDINNFEKIVIQFEHFFSNYMNLVLICLVTNQISYYEL